MVILRKARFSDMDLLYKWANDPIVRKNSFHSEPISYETHRLWFNHMMQDESVCQFILMDGDIPVGQIRLNVDMEEAEIGYSIAKEFRGKGYGRKILQLIIDEVNEQFPKVKKLVAKVKPGNNTSRKLFEREGYDMKYFCYMLEVNRGGVLRVK